MKTKQSRAFAVVWGMSGIAAAALAFLTPTLAVSQGLEEVLVTATRRGETDIQTTPISVTAIDSAAIEALLPHDLNDIALSVPNLVAGNAPAFNSANFSLRGVGQTSIILYQEAPVGVNVDDFVIPHVQTQALEMYDIESIEVLRGPQGTLFGKNTTAGVINVRTKRPEFEEAFVDARLTIGDFGTREGRLAVNAPLSEEIAVRFSGLLQKSDGYYTNGKVSTSFNPFTFAPETFAGDGRDLGGDDVFSGRLKALWKPTEDVNVLLQYEIIRDDSDSPVIINESSQVSGEALPQFGLSQPGDGFNGVTAGDPLDQAAISERNDFFRLSDGHVIDVDGLYANLEWEFDRATLHSVTGIREQESRLPSTYTGEARGSLFDATRDDDRTTFQQEIRVNSNFDGPFNFVAGGFYQTNDVTFCVTQLLGLLDFFGPIFSPNGPLFLGGAGLPGLAVDTHNDNASILCNKQDATALAGFFDLSWDVSDRWQLGAGIRLTEEEKEWAGRAQTFFQFLDGTGIPDENLFSTLSEPLDAADFSRFPAGVAERSESWTEPSWRVTAGFNATDNTFLWVTRSHGFKSGAFNDQTGTFTTGVPTPLTNELQLAPVDPEFADSWELGLKTDLLDDRLRLNIVYFDVTYDDAQRALNAIFPIAAGVSFQETRFFNAAELDVNGVEFEGAWAPIQGLTITGNAAWQDAEFKEFQADTNFDGMIDVDFSGRPVNRAPETTATLALSYSHALAGGRGEFTHNIIGAYEDETVFTYSAIGPEFDAIANDRTLLNWNSTWTSDNGRYMVRVFGKNLTDERYRTGSLAVATLWTMTSFGAPRMFGAEFGVNFDF